MYKCMAVFELLCYLLIDQTMLIKKFHFLFSDAVTVCLREVFLRAWNLPGGQMVWQSSIHGSGVSKTLLTVRLVNHLFILTATF